METFKKTGLEVLQWNRLGQGPEFRQTGHSGLLADHHHQGITLHRHPDGGPVSGTQLHGDCAGFREGKLDVAGNDAVATDHHRQVVQWRIRPEDRLEQAGCHQAVDLDAALHEAAQSDAPFDHDERTELVLREKFDRFGHGIRQFVDLGTSPAEESCLSQADHRLPELRLEDDDQEDRQEPQHLVRDELDPAKGITGLAHEANRQSQQDDDHREALDHPGASGALEESDDQPDADPDDRKLDQDFPDRVTTEEMEDIVDAHVPSMYPD